MKSLLRIAAVALCIAGIVACSKTGTSTAQGGRNPWTIPGTLRYGSPEEPDNLNPMFAHTDATDQVAGLIYSGLLRLDDRGNYIPDLATEVPSYANGGISKDDKTITVHLRKGVVWSDGAPLTAKDWIFTYNAVKNPKNNTKLTVGWDDVASASAPDDYTIVIKLKKPEADILGMLGVAGGSAYPPLPAHLLAKLPDINHASFNSHPISSGPFILQDWDHGRQLDFVANPKYFRGRPKLDKIVWKVVPDSNTLFNQLRAHEVDIYVGVPENQIADLKQISGINIDKKLVGSYRHFEFNTSHPQISDPRVRLAIIEAIDWRHINDTIFRGYNQFGTSDIYPAFWASPKIPPYPYDPNNAKRLLQQAGWAMGSDGILHKGSLAMDISLIATTSTQANVDTAVAIQDALKPLGIRVTLHTYPPSLMFAQNGPAYTGHFDVETSIDTNGADPENSGMWGSAYIPPHGANVVWLRDPIVDKYAELAKTTMDQAKRKVYYQKEEERLHALVPEVVMYWENSYTGMNTDLKNFKRAAFILDTWNSWEWEI